MNNKLYNIKKNKNNTMNKKENSIIVNDFLSLVPSTTLTQFGSLSEEDKRVLAYIISWSNKTVDDHKPNDHCYRDHCSPVFECDCFECYVSFWARWDASENRHVIHEIIEAYEEDLARYKKKKKKKKKKMIEGKSGNKVKKSKRNDNWKRVCDEPRELNGVERLVKQEEKTINEDLVCLKDVDGFEKGSFIRRLLSYVGEKVSAFWT